MLASQLFVHLHQHHSTQRKELWRKLFPSWHHSSPQGLRLSLAQLGFLLVMIIRSVLSNFLFCIRSYSYFFLIRVSITQVKNAMTLTEKIFAKASEKTQLSPGENVWVNVDILMTHDVCGPGSFGIFKKEFGENAKVQFMLTNFLNSWHHLLD